MWKGKLIAAGSNAKTVKGDKASEYVTAIMYLAPADLSGFGNVCPMAILAGCKDGCLNSAGRGGMNSVQQARIRKTAWWFSDRDGFIRTLAEDIRKFSAWCAKKGVKPAVRLNGTSDIQWEKVAPWLFSEFPEVQFYDYTKIAKRFDRELPANYHLTLSYSEANERYASEAWHAHMVNGAPLAVVYRTKAKAQEAVETCKHAPTVDGDKTDLRFLDPAGVLVALYAKGKAKHDRSGFVVD